ncbi:putative class II aldolase [uncultured delta proteobacterium]|uniref:3-oxo-tetronate 4-phosphate decarboxylase n=1 Tax=uncultured delta proteobacterium TaxID=34034 RepID=A0A212IWX7_9DELT|nr:putative class II aldolase [uncultured delta proteobacterium]
MTELEYCTQLVELGASLFARGYSVGGAGNISLLLPGGRVMATPTSSCLGRLSFRDMAVTDMDGNRLGGSEPTKELPLHLAVYKAKPGCKAVVHLHSTYAAALSCLDGLDPENALRPFTPYYVMRIGRLPVVPYYKPGAAELGVAAAKIAEDANAFLLANHGSVVCGTSLIEAVNSAEELEETAKLYFLLLSSGKSIRYLSEKDIAGLAPAKAVQT